MTFTLAPSPKGQPMIVVDARLHCGQKSMGSLGRQVSGAQLGGINFTVLLYLEGSFRRGGKDYCMRCVWWGNSRQVDHNIDNKGTALSH